MEVGGEGGGALVLNPLCWARGGCCWGPTREKDGGEEDEVIIVTDSEEEITISISV